MLFDGIQLVYQQETLIKELQENARNMMAETINCQSSVIKLQEELIAAKNIQVAEIKSSVQSSVESAVVKSYSEAVNAVKSASTPPSEGPVLNQETLKTVVKQVVAEEDRSRNLMVFGLDEEEDEQLQEKVTAIFEELGEKPRHEAVRLGLRKDSKTSRPTKVTLSNSVSVQQILQKAKSLRGSEKYKTVFISPDRCPQERALQKTLILELKKKRQEEPNKRHYLKGGVVQTIDMP